MSPVVLPLESLSEMSDLIERRIEGESFTLPALATCLLIQLIKDTVELMFADEVVIHSSPGFAELTRRTSATLHGIATPRNTNAGDLYLLE